MIVTGRSISKGKACGKVLKLDEPFSFLGGVDGKTGELRTKEGGNISDRIFVFPRGKGSTVGSFTMYDLKVHGKQPAAIINSAAETIVATGAVISSIPMIDSVDVDILRNGDDVTADGNEGKMEIHNVKRIDCVSSAIYVNGKVLMLRRRDDASSFPGVWSLVAGKIESGESANEAAVREIHEETGISVSRPSASLDPIFVRENDVVWKVHPYLFVHDSCGVAINDENAGYKWASLEEMESMRTVTSTIPAVKQLLSKIIP
jgi:predicted aconitase with swiveling domain